MSAALAVVPSHPVTSGTLLAIEESLAAMVETADLVSPEQEEEFIAEFSASLQQAVEKRDRVQAFFVHLESQIALAGLEIKRLRERKALYERTFERLEQYVIRVIKSLGEDAKGKWKKLEGRTVTFSARCCPPSVEIVDEAAVPVEYKTVDLSMPASLWEELLDRLDLEERTITLAQVKVGAYSINKPQVKAAMEHDRIPGVDLAIGNVSLVRK